MNVLNIFIFTLIPCVIWALPAIDLTTETLVAVNKQTPTQDVDAVQEETNELLPPQLKSMNVTSYVRNRYARTEVTSRYANPQSKAQEATFSIVLPNTAFISGFTMEIKGEQYKAYVREKEEAKREYEEAVRGGRAAAHVVASARDSNRFTVSMNVEPYSKVTFNLTYEELLIRKQGKYELVINLNPGQFVKELGVDVHIEEMRRILSVDTPALRSGNEIQDSKTVSKNEFATVKTLNAEGTKVHVSFNPSKEQQIEMAKKLNQTDKDKSLAGQFTVVYDVERDPQGGEVLVSDGYFVHFFAPSDLKPIPKHVIFVLDVSGSMSGRKLEQLKEAMTSILSELSEEDFFDIVKFHTSVQVLGTNNAWIEVENPSSYEHTSTQSATSEKITKAQQTINALTDEGLTNIYDALHIALKIAATKASENNPSNPQPMIIFLTDGQANVGESNSDKIIESVTSRNENAAIFTLAFGEYLDKNLLKELAMKNHGFMRQIYEAADASLQLQNFYKEISSPLLTDVKFQYADDQVTSVTKPIFPIMFGGCELVVAGKIATPTDNFINVEGKARNGSLIFRPIIYPISIPVNENKEYSSLERLWAYLTIKQLLEKKYEKENEIKSLSTVPPEKQALNLALKYSFVTPVTSLVVVKPNKSESVETEEAKPKDTNDYDRILAPPSLVYRSHPQSGIPLSISGARRPMLGFSGAGRRFLLSSRRPLMRPTHITSTPRVYTSTDSDTDEIPVKESIIDHLPWLAPYFSNDMLTIDNKDYMIGNNQTSVEQKACQVESLGYSGNCTLLSACPRLYPSLDSLETFKKYFCTLSTTYAGICCTDTSNN